MNGERRKQDMPHLRAAQNAAAKIERALERQSDKREQRRRRGDSIDLAVIFRRP